MLHYRSIHIRIIFPLRGGFEGSAIEGTQKSEQGFCATYKDNDKESFDMRKVIIIGK